MATYGQLARLIGRERNARLVVSSVYVFTAVSRLESERRRSEFFDGLVGVWCLFYRLGFVMAIFSGVMGSSRCQTPVAR